MYASAPWGTTWIANHPVTSAARAPQLSDVSRHALVMAAMTVSRRSTIENIARLIRT